MALRRNVVRPKAGPLARLAKAALILLCLAGAAAAAFVIWFNGQHVRDPLLRMLNERSSVGFNVSKVEFSPLYPDTLKLHGVTFGKSSAAELYLEYDLKSLLSGKELKIRDLYVRDVKLQDGDLQKIASDRLGFERVSVQALHAVEVPVNDGALSAKSASFELEQAELSKTGFTAAKGSGELKDGECAGIPFKTLSGRFERADAGYSVSDFSAAALGGFVSGDFAYSPKTQSAEFSNLSLERLVLKNPRKMLSKLKLSAPKVRLGGAVIVLEDQDLLISGIDGEAENLSAGDGGVSCRFKGTISEISKPSLQLTAEDSEAEIALSQTSADIRAQGRIFEGQYSTDALIPLAGGAASVRSLNLEGGKVEITPELAQGFLKTPITVGNLSLSKVSLLSHLPQLPLSVREISGTASGFSWSENTELEAAPSGSASFTFEDLFWKDWRCSHLTLSSGFTRSLLTLSVPQAVFGKSRLSLALSLSRDGTGRSFLLAQAHDFDASELNSSSIPHLLSGKFSLDADLRASGRPEDLLQNLSGSLSLKSDSLLVSSFGLDLINGGRQEDHRLDARQLLTLLGDSDCGFHRLNAQLSLKDGAAALTLSSGLSTSELNLSASASLKERTLSGKGYFVSLPRDSMTVAEFSGALKDPLFDLRAVERGEILRPGLFTKSLSAAELEAQAQEQQRRSLKQEQDAQTLLDAVSALKEEIARLDKERQQAQSDAEQAGKAAEAARSELEKAAAANEEAGKALEERQKELSKMQSESSAAAAPEQLQGSPEAALEQDAGAAAPESGTEATPASGALKP